MPTSFVFGGMRSVATVLQTEKGNDMSFPTSDGTSEVGEIVAQNATATAADPTFGVKSLSVYQYSSKVVAIPFALLQDSQIDIEAFVQSRLVTRLGRITNTHFTTGTGTAQPTGVVTAAANGVTAANATSQVTAIELWVHEVGCPAEHQLELHEVRGLVMAEEGQEVDRLSLTALAVIQLRN